MPILTHLNNDQNRINKRIVNAMLRQAQQQMPDVPPPPVDSDVNQNYLSLMKSLTNILLNLRELYAYRFGVQEEGEADYFELPDISDISGSEFSALQSQASQGSQMSYAPIGSVYSQPVSSVASSVSAPFFRRGVNSPASSVYSQPISQVSSSTGQPSSRYGQERLSQYSEPRREEQSIQEREDYARMNPLVLNSLSKEVVNSQFFVETMPFAQLSKIQKEKLKIIIVKINKVKGVINFGISRPIYTKLNKVIKRILSALQEGGEGATSEFLLRTQEQMAPAEGDELIGFGRKRRLLSPAMYNAHNYDPYNVNCNFAYNQAKRNI